MTDSSVIYKEYKQFVITCFTFHNQCHFQVYHWLSAWTCGLSAYLLVALVGMVMVKRSESCLQRLRDCRWLLLSLLTASGLYALP